jgi:DNA-binding IclR family transcriptional regulator
MSVSKIAAGNGVPASAKPAGNGTEVRAVARCLDILERLAQDPELGLLELARETGLRPPTVHRLLATLVQRGYVLQNGQTDRYFISYKLLELVTQASSHGTGLEGLTREHLTRLRDTSGETTSLAVAIQDQAVWIAQEDTDKILRPFVIVGRGTPFHVTAGGKAILAFQPEKLIERFLAREPFPAATRNTLTTRKALAMELDRVLRRGYAIDHEEQEESVTSIAAPIFDVRGYAIAAISICGPTTRMQRVIADTEIADMLLDCTKEVSRRLGWSDGDALDESTDAETA